MDAKPATNEGAPAAAEGATPGADAAPAVNAPQTASPAVPEGLAFQKRFMSMELKATEDTTLDISVPQSTIDRINTAKEQSIAYSNEVKTLKLHISLKKLFEQLHDAGNDEARMLVFDQAKKQLDIVCFLNGIKDTFPEGATFSRSSAAIVWRYKPGQEGEGKQEIEVLLVEELNVKRVSFVAGGQKPGESSLQGAAREVQEEAGLDVDLSTAQWLRTDEMKSSHGELNTLNTFAIQVKDPDQPIKRQVEEIKAAGWYSVAEALEVMSYDSAKNALRAFVAGRGVPVVVHDWDEEGKAIGWGVAAPAAEVAAPEAEAAAADAEVEAGKVAGAAEEE